MARCQIRVTHRNPYMLPPNTWDEFCKHEAVEGDAWGRCKFHITVERKQRARMQAKHANRLRRQRWGQEQS